MRARIPYIILQSTGGIYLVMLNSSQGVYRPLLLIIMLACVTAAAARLAEPLVRAEWARIVKHSMFTAFMVSVVLLSPT